VRPFGATMHVTAERAELLDVLDLALARVPTDAGVEGSLSLDIAVHPDHDGDPAWPDVAVDDTPEHLTLTCGSGSLTVDHAHRASTVRVPESLAANEDALRCMVEGALWSVLIRAGALHAIHSGLVVSPGGRGVLLRGESGAGKSTLTYACMLAGFSVASDDWVYAVADQPAGLLYGYPWRLFLMPDTVRFFPELAAVDAVPHPSVDRRKLPIVPLQDAQTSSADVDVVVFVSADAGGSITEIGTDEAIARWWASALPSERADVPEPWVASLLERRCYHVGRGDHPASLAAEIGERVSA
jgi:hypothetical protein